jgi:hypothetical protein
MSADVKKVPDLTPPTKVKAEKAPKEAKEKKPAVPRVSNFAKLYPDDAKVTLLVEKNPKRGKSKDRFEAYFHASTVGEARKGGVTYADLAWDVGHGLIKIG